MFSILNLKILLFITPLLLLPEPSTQLAGMNLMEMSKKFGYPAVIHEVVTVDGYVLKLFRLKGKTSKWKYPVLVMHGICDTADSWVLRGNSSLSITLANAGYDVWLGNTRGNRYSRKHFYLDPDLDSTFWNFTFHEHGIYDLPAMIDIILKKTNSEKLNLIGHSQGTTIAYVLGSSRPEYNKKINVMIALAPVAYLHNIDSPISIVFKHMPILSEIANQLKIYEIFGQNSQLTDIFRAICSLPNIGYMLCVENILFPISGADPAEFDPNIYSIVNTYFPNSTSRKNFEHFAQLYNTKYFRQYDYGSRGNKVQYNSSEPPEYDISKVTMPVALLVGINDKLSTVKDVEILKTKLPNLVDYIVSPRKTFNHLDDLWGKNMKNYLFPYVMDILKRYNQELI